MIRLLFALFVLTPTLAGAQLSLEDCPGAPAAATTKLVQLELAGEPAEVSLRCQGETANIVVRGTSPMSLSLTATPPAARPRLLAISIAELVATSRLEGPTPPLALPKPRAVSLWLEAGAAIAPDLWSPTLLAGGSYGYRILAQADLALEAGRRETRAATLYARMLSLSVAPLVPVLRGRTSVALGVGMRLGWAWLSASSRREGVVGQGLSGLYAASIARAMMAVVLHERWSLRLDLELGYVVKAVRGLDAGGEKLLELAGLRTAAALGLQLAL